jgi:hypothetical protein
LSVEAVRGSHYVGEETLTPELGRSNPTPITTSYITLANLFNLLDVSFLTGKIG